MYSGFFYKKNVLSGRMVPGLDKNKKNINTNLGELEKTSVQTWENRKNAKANIVHTVNKVLQTEISL